MHNFLRIIFFLFLSFQIYAKEVQKLRLGVVNYPPYYDFSNPKKPKGIVLKAVSKVLEKNYKIQWEEIPLSRGQEALNTDVIDIYLGFRKTAEREKQLSFSENPYIQAQPHVCGYKKAIQILKEEKRITGRIVVPSKAKVPPQLLKHQSIAIDYSNYIPRGISLLKSKRASMVMVPDTFMTHFILNKTKDVECTSFGNPVLMYFVFKKYSPLKQEIEKMDIPNFTEQVTSSTTKLLEKQK